MLNQGTPCNFDTAQQQAESARSIFAWATAPGRSGVAILRLSGSQLQAVASWLGIAALAPRTAQLVTLRHPHTQEVIDQALALYFPAPHSFTGEDVLELHTHGSLAIIHELTELLASHPALRLAEAGEFSRRAYLNGKFDLIEAEGLADLIDAETTTQKQQALRTFTGEASAQFESFRLRILQAMALMEAYIDFPDEEIPETVTEEAKAALAALACDIKESLDDRGIGQKIRSGFSIVIAGAPNAGKSSLINALSQRDVAIVSPQAGTTRDAIEVELDIGGYRVILTDTAGLRNTSDAIESEGIRRAHDRLTSADLIIALFDPATTICSHTQGWLGDPRALAVFSKSDLYPEQIPEHIHGHAIIRASSHQPHGLDALIAAIKERVSQTMTTAHTPIITRARHRAALEQCLHHLHRYGKIQALELATEELRQAALQIAKITGKIQVDDVLDIVFSSFCIGK